MWEKGDRMKDSSHPQEQEMLPFVNALRQFFVVAGVTKSAQAEDRHVVPAYLARIASGVLETMTQLKPAAPAEITTLPLDFTDSTSATAGFAGAYSGSVSIHCPTTLATVLASRMTGLDDIDEPEIIHDALAEMAGVLAGEIKQALSVSGLDIQMATPGVVSGSHYLLSAANHQRVTVTFMLEGAPIHISMVAERNRFLHAAAAELRDKREWLSLAVEGGRLGLWHWEPATGKARYSDEWATMLGYESKDLILDIMTWESLVHPDDLPRLQATLREYRSGQCTSNETEHRLAHSSGEWRWILARGRVVEHHDDGTPKLVAGTQLDITERKTAELALYESRQELKCLNEQLEERVAEEILKNRDKESRLRQQEKLVSIGQLAAGVAHEINNPMAFIAGNLKVLAQYFEQITAYSRPLQTRKGATAAEMEYILTDGADVISESMEGAERVTKIVADLKSFSRVDALESEPMALPVCMESALNLCINELKYKATIRKEYGPMPEILCNPGQLNQVFLHLLVNAGQAIVPPGEITLRCWHDDEFVYASVGDTGTGIPEKVKNRLFEPFFTTKDVGKGTGLGLSVSYEIVKNHQGEILVESEPGKGSTFTVKLPRTLETHYS
jgi:PAS domain S-box-containing protein